MSYFKNLLFKKGIGDKFSKNRVLKFDMSEYDASYDTAIVRFRMVGIRLISDDTSLAKLLWNALYIFEFASLLVTLILELVNMVQQAAVGIYTDVFKMTPCIGFIILATVKTYKIVYDRPVYESLISELREMWPLDPVTEEEYKIIRSELITLNRFAKGYWYCNAALLLIFGSVPFIFAIQNIMGYNVPLTLVLSYWFPFDPFKHGRFEVLAVIQTWLCFLAVSFISGADILFCTLLSHITTQFDLLAIRIKKTFYVPTDDQLIEAYPLAEYSKGSKGNLESNINEYEKYQKSVVEIVSRHRTLIRLSASVENQFTFPLLINFMNSSVLICFCGFCCVFVEKWNEINYKLFLLSAIVQIWLLCWYGQKLINSSEKIAHGIYSSGWYNVPQNIKSSFIIIFYRAQKVVYLTTYGFSIVSMASYSAILKTSWSYLMLLKTIFDE